jgi:phospholipase C
VRAAAGPLVWMAIVTAACSSAELAPSPRATPDISATPATRPAGADAVDATEFETRWPIKHVVFLIKENRTFDHLFGTFPGARGVTTGMDHGRPRPLVRGTDHRLPFDIPHCYECAIWAWNHGRMDVFDQGKAGDWAYTQLHRSQLPNYWRWARAFVLFDNFFASAHGPSFPNHLYTIAAQSGGRGTIRGGPTSSPIPSDATLRSGSSSRWSTPRGRSNACPPVSISSPRETF